MNARFWTWWNGDWVKLTLRPGEVVLLYESHETDEGYSFQEERFEHDGDSLIRESASGGRDCDGPITYHSVCECRLSNLPQAAEPECPPWARLNAWQRDTYAEMAGY